MVKVKARVSLGELNWLIDLQTDSDTLFTEFTITSGLSPSLLIEGVPEIFTTLTPRNSSSITIAFYRNHAVGLSLC